MATFAGIAAETDCCGNLYPLHIPLASRRTRTGGAWLAATTLAVATRVVWAAALVCARAGLL